MPATTLAHGRGGAPALRIAAAVLLLLFVRTAGALGPNPAERLLLLGKCSPDGQPCAWDAARGPSGNPVCENAEENIDPRRQCELDVAQVFTAQLRLEVDESACASGEPGARVRMDLRGRKSDGSTFSASDEQNLCGVDVGCKGEFLPRPAPFRCSTDCGNSPCFVNEKQLPGPGWFADVTLPPNLSSQVASQFPPGSGMPIAAELESCPSFEDHSTPTDARPSVKRYCLKMYMVRPPGPIPGQ